MPRLGIFRIMKTIGLIGGISPESTLDYYKFLNTFTRKKLGGDYSAKLLLYSVNFSEIVALQKEGNWDELARLMTGIAQNLERAGAQCLLIGANTMHKIAPELQHQISIPIIHIADVTALEMKKHGTRRSLLLGTRYTMQGTFYTERIQKAGMDVFIPSEEEMTDIHTTIYTELTRGIITRKSHDRIVEIVENSRKNNATESVILGCTELPMILKPRDVPELLFNTTELHCQAAVDFALG